MKNKDTKDIDVWFIIELIYKLLKTDHEHFLIQIPFLIRICDFAFKRSYLTFNQKASVYHIYNEYKIYLKMKRNA